jgi:serine/threonine-protein kinase ATR
MTNDFKILKLAEAKGTTAARMFNPYWDKIAIVAVKDLLSRPQTTQLLSDILGISVPEFLVLTQSNTLPYLVLAGQIDVIRRIQQARKDKEDWMPVWDNAVPILALLLVQDVPDVEQYFVSLVKPISSRFHEKSFTEWVALEPAGVATRLVRLAGEADDKTKLRVSI